MSLRQFLYGMVLGHVVGNLIDMYLGSTAAAAAAGASLRHTLGY